MIGAAKRKSSLLPGLAALRLVLLLIVTLCLGETRVWGFGITSPSASGVFESVTLSPIGENTIAWQYDASDSPLAARGVANPVPGELARVIPGRGPFPTLGPPGRADVFVTAADDIAGLTPAQISQRLTIPASDTFSIIRFPTPSTGIASPVFRTDPGFIGGGRTLGGAREFVLPNGSIPSGATTTILGP